MNELLDALQRQAGLTGRYLASGVGGLGAAFANPLAVALNSVNEAVGSDYRFPDQYEALQSALSSAGLPEPQGALEKGVGFASELGVPDPTDSARVVAQISHMVDPSMMDNLIQAMTVFHGSPHKWDRVDLSKVGTGEGAQAYGHGFYVAENPEVAGEYRRKLSKAVIPVTRMREGGGFRAGFKDTEDGPITWLPEPAHGFGFQSQGEAIKAIERNQGHLYELDLPDSTIDKMLDWDKPLSEQPESVRKALGADLTDGLQGKFLRGELSQDEVNSIMGKVPTRHAFPQDRSGQAIYFDIGLLAQKRGYDGDIQQAASAYMNDLGIPGIKYLDGTSRKQPDTVAAIMQAAKKAGYGDNWVKYKDDLFAGKIEPPTQTRNFVVFDESYITPLKRNNEPIK